MTHPNFPLHEIAKSALAEIERGGTVYQKFTCAKCGARQTIDEPNKFFTSGKCEECGHVTNIQVSGCNYLLIHDLKG